MNLLIRSARIIDPQSPFHQKVTDLFIRNGHLEAIGKNLSPAGSYREIRIENCHVSPGWLDLYASIPDPGFEYKEDIQSGLAAAAAGGFTAVAVRPDTYPPVQAKGEVDYMLGRARGNVVDIYPLAAITRDRKGRELTEIFDLQAAGVRGWTEGDNHLADAGVMMRSLQYVKPFDGVIISRPSTPSLNSGPVNEGMVNVALGMKGSPALSEELALHRDISLAAYAGSRLHFSKISTSGSVAMLRDARRNEIPVTSSVASYHLLLGDKMVESFDTNYKVNPPLRSRSDIKELIRGLRDGTIDAICSDHNPQDEESKKKEFEYAEDGIINFETAFASANTALREKIPLEQLVRLLAINPRRILGLESTVIEKEAVANLTLFDPDLEWVFSEKDIFSKSKNTPFLGYKFTGKALGVINNSKSFIHGD